ncbi:MAG TPA: hypothetical protein VFA60_15430 [Terriglobales bacterium]|nr:hypothetical protein [Terriglobales bacterium]
MDVRDAYTWGGIAAIVLSSTAGEILIAGAMQQVGDMGEITRARGVLGAARAVVSNARFWMGVGFLAIGYFSLLLALSWGDVSLVVPASASLTFVTNAVAARIFLHERVDGRRWMAAAFVAGGVALLAR